MIFYPYIKFLALGTVQGILVEGGGISDSEYLGVDEKDN